VQWSRPSKLEDKFDVRALPDCDFSIAGGAKLRSRPHLPFIFAEVLNVKWANAGYRQKPLSSSVNGKPPQIAGDPAPAIPFGNSSRRAASAKAI
jgi:hypothetical protein